MHNIVTMEGGKGEGGLAERKQTEVESRVVVVGNCGRGVVTNGQSIISHLPI